MNCAMLLVQGCIGFVTKQQHCIAVLSCLLPGGDGMVSMYNAIGIIHKGRQCHHQDLNPDLWCRTNVSGYCLCIFLCLKSTSCFNFLYALYQVVNNATELFESASTIWRKAVANSLIQQAVKSREELNTPLNTATVALARYRDSSICLFCFCLT